MMMLDAALDLALRDWRVFPLKPGAKTPITEHGVHDATTDPEQIHKWWEKTPDANIGVAAGQESGLLVLDFDVKNGKRGLDSLEFLEQKFGALNTRIAKTASSGLHLYFKNPERKLRNRVDVLDGVDVRTDGGYVVAPPSVVDGHEYQWIVDTELAPLPAGIVDILHTPEPDAEPVEHRAEHQDYPEDRQRILERARKFIDVIPPAVEGAGGDAHTYKLCCKLVRGFNLSDQEALGVLSPWNARCQPPWSERDLLKKIDGARKYGDEPIGGKIGNATSRGESRNALINERRDENSEVPHAESDAWQIPTHWKWLDVANLRDWNCLPLRWTVQDLIAHGNFVIIAAETQTGKTLFGLFLSHSILHEGKLFGRLDITPVDKILYMGLEDPDRRFKERLLDIQHSFPVIESGQFIVHTAPDFTLTDEKMVTYLEYLIVTHGFNIVFLDTYQKATPGLTSFDDEKQAVILHRLSNLTRKHDITLIVLDHVRKRDGKQKRNVLSVDDIKGTGSKPQNADCIILVERTPDRKQIKLQSFSKDSDQNIRILLDVSPKGSSEPKFQYAADLDQLGSDAKAKGEANLNKILGSMIPGEWTTAPKIAECVQLSETAVKKHLKTLYDAKKIDETGEKRGKRYCRLSTL